MSQGRPLIFGFNIDPMGHHNGAWRHPGSDPSKLHSIEYEIELAQKAEAAGFEMLFIADSLAFNHGAADETAFVKAFEPFTLFAAVASHTRYPGLVCTVSSTYTEPYNLARYLTSLDHVSHGRAAWNIVTTADPLSPKNFGLEAPVSHGERYAVANDVAEAAFALWDSWEDDAVVADQGGGRFFDKKKVAPANYQGRYRSTAGPLNVVPSPQKRPVIVQAGQSPDGRAFAAKYAEVVYMVAQHIDDAREYYQDIKQRIADAGRDPKKVFVIMSVRVLVEPTTEAAEARNRELFDLLPLEKTLANVSKLIGLDLTSAALDDQIPELPEPESTETFQTQLAMVRNLVARGQIRTLRDLGVLMNGGQGVLSITGAPETVADDIQRWADAGVTDGFMILPQQTQVDGPNFTDLVVPLLKERRLMADASPQKMTFRQRLNATAERG